MLQSGEIVAEATLSYAGVKNTFTGNIKVPVSGEAKIQILAMDPGNANLGMVERTVKIMP